MSCAVLRCFFSSCESTNIFTKHFDKDHVQLIYVLANPSCVVVYLLVLLGAHKICSELLKRTPTNLITKLVCEICLMKYISAALKMISMRMELSLSIHYLRIRFVCFSVFPEFFPEPLVEFFKFFI